MKQYKVALQILLYCSKVPGFKLGFNYNMDGHHEFHDHPLTFFIWKNTDVSVKEGSKREMVLKMLLKLSDNDVLLVKNKEDISAFDFLIQKEHFKVNNKNRKLMIDLISKQSLRLKYLFMVCNARPLAKLNINLKILVAQNLA